MSRLTALAILLLALVQPIFAQTVLTPAEVAQTLRHGPWPQAQARDPSNRFSGDPTAIELGAALFSDPLLSSDGSMSCASCHDPAHDFTDGRKRAMGRETLDRNTQSLWNLSTHRWFGWAGDTDSIWAQSITPLLNAAEMGHTHASLQSAIQSSQYATRYTALSSNDATPAHTTVNISKILAAYIETLQSGKTSFDRFRDALATDNSTDYPLTAQRGLQIFLGEGRCVFCHSGPTFTNGEFHDAGVPYFIEAGRVDEGRFGGINALKSSPYTLDGSFTDDPDKSTAWPVRNVRFQHSDFGIFRTPSLRRIARTAPYMHNGSLPDLRAVLDHYNTINMERLHTDGEAILRPLELSPDQLSNLEAFLLTLSDDAP